MSMCHDARRSGPDLSPPGREGSRATGTDNAASTVRGIVRSSSGIPQIAMANNGYFGQAAERDTPKGNAIEASNDKALANGPGGIRTHTSPRAQRILSPLRLPIPPRGRVPTESSDLSLCSSNTTIRRSGGVRVAAHKIVIRSSRDFKVVISQDSILS